MNMRSAAMRSTIVMVLVFCGACAGVLQSPDRQDPHEPLQVHQQQGEDAARIHAEAVERAQRVHAEAHRAAMEAAHPQPTTPVPQP